MNALKNFSKALLVIWIVLAPSSRHDVLHENSVQTLITHSSSVSDSVSIRVDGQYIGSGSTIQDFEMIYSKLLPLLANSKAMTSTISFGQMSYQIDLPALGEGARGIVYRIHGSNRVIKLPKGKKYDFEVLGEEHRSFLSWNEAAQSSGHFAVGQTLETHPQALYAVKNFVTGETLAEFFFRFGLVKIDATGKAIIHRNASQILSDNPEVQKVALAVMDMVRAIQKSPSLGLSLSPHNMIVTYADALDSSVAAVTLIDLGLETKLASRYEEMHEFSQYLENSIHSINKDIELARDHVSRVHFEQVQKDSQFLSGLNLDGDQIRIAGLTPEIYAILAAEISMVLRAHQLKASSGFFFGSRVMPRSEVNRRHPDTNLPILDDGVDKSYVRTSGLTNISDLEMFVTLANNVEAPPELLLMIKSEVKARIQSKMRLFPVDVRFLNSRAGNTNQISDIATVVAYADSKARQFPSAQYIRVSEIEKSYNAHRTTLRAEVLSCQALF